jgi:hypothetical protein
MGNLNNALQELRAERKQAQARVESIDQAISCQYGRDDLQAQCSGATSLGFLGLDQHRFIIHCFVNSVGLRCSRICAKPTTSSDPRSTFPS